MKRIALFLNIFFLVLVSASAQDILSAIGNNVHEYILKSPAEQYLVQTHQPVYVPGDTVYYVAKPFIQTGPQDLVLRISLINAASEIVWQSKVKMTKYVVRNQLILPASMAAGIYRLVAYPVTSSLMESAYMGSALFSIAGEHYVPAPTPHIDVASEGGHLVQGIMNHVVFRSSTGVSFRTREQGGSWVDRSGDFSWTGILATQVPVEVEVLSDGKYIPVALPQPERQGVTLVMDSGSVNPIFHLYAQGVDADLFVIVCSKLGVVYRSTVSVRNGSAVIHVPPVMSQLQQLLIVDRSYRVLASRLYRSTAVLEPAPRLVLEKKQYHPREQVSIGFVGTEGGGAFSLTVVKASLFNKAALSSDWQTTNLTRKDAVNDELITSKFEFFPGKKLKDIASNSIAGGAQPFEVLKGQVVLGDTGLPPGDSTKLMFLLERSVIGYEVLADKQGNFSLPIIFPVDNTDLVFFTANRKGRDINDVRIKWIVDSLESRVIKNVSVVNVQDEAYQRYMFLKRNVDRSYQYYTTPTVKSNTDPNVKFIEEMDDADVSVEPRDYIHFNSVSELVKEVLPAVEHRVIRGRDVLRVYTTYKRPTNETGPLLIIDGTLTRKAADFLTLDPAIIQYIKVFKDSRKLMALGAAAEHGVIMVRTNRTEPARYATDQHFELTGLSQFSPSLLYTGLSKAKDRIPDFRPVLVWQPELSGERLTFQASDDVGEYMVIIRGTTEDGRSVQWQEKINITPGVQ